MARSFNLTANLQIRGPVGLRQVIQSINAQLNNQIKANIRLNITTSTINNLNKFNSALGQINRRLLQVQSNAMGATHALQGLHTQIKQIGGANSRTITSINRLNSSLNQSNSTMQRFGKQAAQTVQRYGAFTLVTASIFKLIGAAQNAFREAVEFERELIKVSQVTGRTTTQLGDLEREVSRLSTAYGVSSKKLIDASQVLAQAGFTAKQTKGALETLAKTELAPTFEGISDTTEAMIAMMQQFGIEVKDLDRVFGSINAVAGQFAVEASDITTAIRRAGSAFRVTSSDSKDGVKALQEFISLLTSVRSATRESAEAISTGFRTIFTRLQRRRTGDFLKELGINLRDSKGLFKGGFEAIAELNRAMADIPTVDPRFSRIIEELGGFRQVNKVIPLINNFSVAVKAMGVAQRGENSLTKDAATAQQSLLIKLTKVREEFLKLFRLIANNSSIKRFSDAILGIAKTLTQLARSLEPVLPLLGVFGAIKLAGAAHSFGRGFIGHFQSRGGIGAGGPTAEAARAGQTASQTAAILQNTLALKQLTVTYQTALHSAFGIPFPTGAAYPLNVNAIGGGTGGGGGGGRRKPRTVPVRSRRRTPTASMIGTFGGLIGLGALSYGINNLDDETSENVISTLGTGLVAAGLGYGIYRGASRPIARLRQRMSRPTAISPARQAVLLRHLNILQRRRRLSVGAAGFGSLLAVGASGYLNRQQTGQGVSPFGEAVSGAVSSGVTAGLIGASVSGPYAPLVGGLAALGGAVYGAVSAFRSATVRLQQLNFEKTFNKITDSINRILTGKSSTSAQAAGLIGNIGGIKQQLGSGNAEVVNQSIDLIKGAAPALEDLLSKIGENVKSLDQLEQAEGGLGKSILELLSIANSTPMDSLREEMIKLIDTQQKATEVQLKLNAAQEQSYIEVTKFVQLGHAIEQATHAVGVGTAIKTGFGGNTALGFRGAPGTSLGLLQNPQFALSQTNLARTIAQVTPDQQLSNVAQTVAKAFQELPLILTNIRGKGFEGEQVEQQLEKSLSHLPTFLSNQIISVISHKFLGGEQGSEAKLFRRIDDNVQQVVSDIFQSFKPMFDALHQGGEVLHEQINTLGTRFAHLTDLELKITEGRIKAERMTADHERTLAPLQSRQVNLKLVEQSIRESIAIPLKEVGLAGNSGAAAIGGELLKTFREMEDVGKKLQQIDAKELDSVSKLHEEFAKLTEKSLKLKKALEDQADGTELLNVKLEQVNKLAGTRKAHGELVSDFLFGDVSARHELARTIKAGATAITRNSLSGMTGQNRQRALSFLQHFENVPVSPGGKTGLELRRSIIKNDTGFDIGEPNKEEAALIDEIKALMENQKTAQNVLNDILRKNTDELRTGIREDFQQFLAGFKTLQLEGIRQGLHQRLGEAQGRVAAAGERLTTFSSLTGRFGNLANARTVLGAVGQFQRLAQNRALFNTLTNKAATIGNQLNGQKFGDIGIILRNIFGSHLDEGKLIQLEQTVKGRFPRGTNPQGTIQGGELVTNPVKDFLKPIFDQIQKEFKDTDEQIRANFGTNFKLLDVAKEISENADAVKQLANSLELLKNVSAAVELERESKAAKRERANIHEQLDVVPPNPVAKAFGGSIFSPRGSDTVPAMLTPGEFVVKKDAAARNMDLLMQMNAGYYAGGGRVKHSRLASLRTKSKTEFLKERRQKEKEQLSKRISERKHELLIHPPFHPLTPAELGLKRRTPYNELIAKAKRLREATHGPSKEPNRFLSMSNADIARELEIDRARREQRAFFHNADMQALHARSKEIDRKFYSILARSQTTGLGTGRNASFNALRHQNDYQILKNKLAQQELSTRGGIFNQNLATFRGAQRKFDITHGNMGIQLQQYKNSPYNYNNRIKSISHIQSGINSLNNTLKLIEIKNNIAQPKFLTNPLGEMGNTFSSMFNRVRGAFWRTRHFAGGGFVEPIERPIQPLPSARNTYGGAARAITGLAGNVSIPKQAAGGGLNFNTLSQSVSNFNTAINQFGDIAKGLEKAMSAIPHTITIQGKETVEVIITGAQAWSEISKPIGEMIDRKIQNAVSKLYKGPLQGAGPVPKV